MEEVLRKYGVHRNDLEKCLVELEEARSRPAPEAP
jgi:hypothetical protein